MINRPFCDSYGNPPTERHSMNDQGQSEAELDIVEGRVSKMEGKPTKGPQLRHRRASGRFIKISERGELVSNS